MDGQIYHDHEEYSNNEQQPSNNEQQSSNNEELNELNIDQNIQPQMVDELQSAESHQINIQIISEIQKYIHNDLTQIQLTNAFSQINFFVISEQNLILLAELFFQYIKKWSIITIKQMKIILTQFNQNKHQSLLMGYLSFISIYIIIFEETAENKDEIINIQEKNTETILSFNNMTTEYNILRDQFNDLDDEKRNRKEIEKKMMKENNEILETVTHLKKQLYDQTTQLNMFNEQLSAAQTRFELNLKQDLQYSLNKTKKQLNVFRQQQISTKNEDQTRSNKMEKLIYNISNENYITKKNLNSMKSELNLNTNNSSTLKDKLDSMKADLNIKTTESSALKKQFNILKTLSNQTNKKINSFETEIQPLSNSISMLHKKNLFLSDSFHKMNTEVKDIMEQTKLLQSSEKQQRSLIHDLQTDKNQLIEFLRSSKSKQSSWNLSILSLNNEIKTLEKGFSELNERLFQLKKHEDDLKSLFDNFQKLKQTLTLMFDEIKTIKVQNLSLKNQAFRFSEELSSLKTALNQLKMETTKSFKNFEKEMIRQKQQFAEQPSMQKTIDTIIHNQNKLMTGLEILKVDSKNRKLKSNPVKYQSYLNSIYNNYKK